LATRTDFDAWADGLRNTHPEMFGVAKMRRISARRKWHPIYLRVYGIRPWEMGRYDIHEVGLMNEDIEKHGLGHGF